MKVSTLLANQMMNMASPAFEFMAVFSGPIPANGSAAVTGTLLASWGPITMNAAVAGVVTPSSLPLASNAAVATGTAGYAVFAATAALTIPLMYCSVGTAGAEVNLSTLSITEGATVDLTAMRFNYPIS